MDDLFDDIAPTTTTTTTRGRLGGRFAPKAKSKQPPSKKNVSAISSSTTHKESQGIPLTNESHNAVPVTSSIEESRDNLTAQPVHPANDVENVLNKLAAISTTCSTIGSNKELPINGEGSFLDSNKSLEVIDNSLEVSLNVGFKSTSGDINTGISESNIQSSFDFGEVREVLSAEIELDPFSDVLPDPGTRKAKKFQPKIKSRPRVSNTPAIASASSGIPFSEDNSNLEAVIPSHPNSLNVMPSESTVHDVTRDLPSSFGKSAAETADVFLGLESLNDVLNQDATGTANADSPTLADLLQQDGTGEKEDANGRKKCLKKHKISSIAGVEDKGGKTSRQPRKQAARKPTTKSLNEAVDDDDVLDPPYVFDGDELEENDDEDEVDYSSKKTSASTSSKKKSVAKNGKTSKKRKKANDDSKEVTEEPPKKFPHSSRRRKRCVDKALLENDYLDQRTLSIRNIILLAEHKERLAKKEATTSETPSTNQSDGDFLHEADANNEEEYFGSDDEFRDPDDDQASEKITSTTPLLNYQSFMNKAPRGKWSTRDTEMFYEAIRQFGTDFTMIQLLFPDKSRHQIKLKYKKEERQHPLLLSDAMNNRGKDLSCFKLAVERQKQNSTKEEQDTAGDASDLMPGEEDEDPTPGTNEEVATTEQGQDHIDVKDQEDSMAYPVPGQSDDSENEFENWENYQSAI